ncbi:MAG: TetR/AcrR family transcriptional regulator, partial [Frankiales bacterium]|nr:TetR/AcrR family transcriptional regulator [Frankiales bacterium]
MTASAPRTARARARAELTAEIKAVARRHVATNGAADLSLRAVARDLGMVSSAVYRYFPSRDDLLTALIVDAYNAVGEAAETAEAAVRRTDLLRRWLAAARAVRSWAQDNPQEYALIFGSPIPGYQAPQDTVDPATRIPLLLLTIIGEAVAPPDDLVLPRAVGRDLKRLRDQVAPSVSEARLARAVMAWTHLIGGISFELFGHLVGSIDDYSAWFDLQM